MVYGNDGESQIIKEKLWKNVEQKCDAIKKLGEDLDVMTWIFQKKMSPN